MNERCESVAIADSVIYTSHPDDIFYLTGAKVSRGALFLHPDKAALFLDGRYYDTYRESLMIEVYEDSEERRGSFLQSIRFSKVFLDPDALSHTEYTKVANGFDRAQIEQRNPIKERRSVKDEKEIALMRMAADLATKAISYVEEILEPGVSELDMSLQFEIFARERGAKGSSFEPIIAFGEHAADPHHRPSERKLSRGEAVIIDAGVTLRDYRSDLTRSFWFDAEPDEEYRQADMLVSQAMEVALERCKPGAKIKELSDAVCGFFKRQGVLDLFKHSLGHGIGLAVHEWPTISPKSPDFALKPGMVFCIEPGLYQKGRWGIRKEEMVLITERGYELLSSPEPNDLYE